MNLDPFAGSGTVNRVAEHHGRLGLGFELNPDYCDIAAKRNAQASLLPLAHGGESNV